jgi:hypothetical protein
MPFPGFLLVVYELPLAGERELTQDLAISPPDQLGVDAYTIRKVQIGKGAAVVILLIAGIIGIILQFDLIGSGHTFQEGPGPLGGRALIMLDRVNINR